MLESLSKIKIPAIVERLYIFKEYLNLKQKQ